MYNKNTERGGREICFLCVFLTLHWIYVDPRQTHTHTHAPHYFICGGKKINYEVIKYTLRISFQICES